MAAIPKIGKLEKSTIRQIYNESTNEGGTRKSKLLVIEYMTVIMYQTYHKL